MKLEQRTLTTIVAEDGKLLRRKNDGMIFGDRLSLGYNYYEAGIGLPEPHYETPDDYEEVDVPEDYAETMHTPVDHHRRLLRAMQLMEAEKLRINGYGLTDAEALELADLFPELGKDISEGATLERGDRFRYGGKLYAVLQTHTLLPLYFPSADTADLYREVEP